MNLVGIHSALEIHGCPIIESNDATITAVVDGHRTHFDAQGRVLAIERRRWFRPTRKTSEKARNIMMMAAAPKVKQPVIVAVAGGFYFFGDRVQGDPDYLTLASAAMFGGFQGNKGLPAVARGDSAATVTLDRFSPTALIASPLFSGATLSIMQSIDLYRFKGTTFR